MNIQVTRKYYTETSTVSELSIDGKFYSHILEDKTRAPQETKVFGKTAIPAGSYQVIVNMSTRFKKMLPLLISVPGYEGVRLHPGNSDVDTLGCLLPGMYDPKTPNWVSGSKVAFDKIFSVLYAAYAGGQKITLTITDTKVFEPAKSTAKARK